MEDSTIFLLCGQAFEIIKMHLPIKWIVKVEELSEMQNHLYHSGYRSRVTSWPPSICSSGGVDTHHVPDILEQPILTPLLTLNTHSPPFPVALEATGLMGTAYLYPAPYQIVDMNRYPRNENILLLLTLTLAYMDLRLHSCWDKQLLCGVCVGCGEYLWVTDRCIK